MKIVDNKGFDPEIIEGYKRKMAESGNHFLFVEPEENNEEYHRFYFIGKFEGREVVYDAVLYTLRLEHQSELFERAEQQASQRFPQYKKIAEKENVQLPDELEEEIGLFMAEVIMELEAEEQVKVGEHLEIDHEIDFGIGLDVRLNIEKITPEVIDQFISQFNLGTLQLDPTLYSFQTNEEESDD